MKAQESLEIERDTLEEGPKHLEIHANLCVL